MHTLFYSPAASSLTVHIALEEAGLPHELVRVSAREGKTREPAYLAINPLGQVPALRAPGGEVLTQVLAQLDYVAQLAPAARLLPTGTLERAQALSIMSFLATTGHDAFRNWYRPQQCVPDDEQAQAAVRDAARARFFDALKYLDARLASRTWLLGHAYTLCDANAFCFYLCGQHFDWPVAELQRYRDLAQRVAARPATQRALASEGFSGERAFRIA